MSILIIIGALNVLALILSAHVVHQTVFKRIRRPMWVMGIICGALLFFIGLWFGFGCRLSRFEQLFLLTGTLLIPTLSAALMLRSKEQIPPQWAQIILLLIAVVNLMLLLYIVPLNLFWGL